MLVEQVFEAVGWCCQYDLFWQLIPVRCSAGAKFYTRLQHACAVGTSRAISSAHRRVTSCVWRHLAQNLSASRSLKIQASGGESGAKQRSTSHVRHIETSLTLNNRTVALCGVFSADVLAYRLTQNILQYVGWWRFEAARDWCGCVCDVIQVWRVQPRFRLRVAEQRSGCHHSVGEELGSLISPWRSLLKFQFMSPCSSICTPVKEVVWRYVSHLLFCYQQAYITPATYKLHALKLFSHKNVFFLEKNIRYSQPRPSQHAYQLTPGDTSAHCRPHFSKNILKTVLTVLKEIVHLQHGVLNWDSRLAAHAEYLFPCKLFAWKHSSQRSLSFSRTSLVYLKELFLLWPAQSSHALPFCQ